MVSFLHAVPISPVDTDDDDRRIAALVALDLLDSAPEREFDAIVALAVSVLQTPFAAITLVGRDRLWMKAHAGVSSVEEPREFSFCHYTIQSEDVLVVSDAELDPRFDARGIAYGGHVARFYAGTPIHAPSGERIGALCVGDVTPRTLDPDEIESLRQLAVLVDALIAARSTARDAVMIATESGHRAEQLQRQERVLLQAERLASIGSWRFSLDDDALEWSDNTFRIHGLTVGDLPSIESALDFYPPHARAAVSQALAATIETGASMDVETDFLTAQGLARRVRAIGELECAQGRPIAIVGVFQDVTDRYMLEQALRRSADRDELTGIANRAMFNRALKAAIETARSDRSQLLLALLDLDGFKAVNDTHGHLAGDDVLKAIGRRLEQPWLAGSLAARLGGDEFALVVTDPALAADPAAFAMRLERALCSPVTVGALTLPCTATVGAAVLATTMDTARDLIHEADTILYAAKRRRAGERRRSERRAR